MVLTARGIRPDEYTSTYMVMVSQPYINSLIPLLFDTESISNFDHHKPYPSRLKDRGKVNSSQLGNSWGVWSRELFFKGVFHPFSSTCLLPYYLICEKKWMLQVSYSCSITLRLRLSNRGMSMYVTHSCAFIISPSLCCSIPTVRLLASIWDWICSFTRSLATVNCSH